MSRIYYLMGKSASGKDTIYKHLREMLPELKTVTIYTTRPIREGEKEGEEYHFTDDAVLERFQKEGKVIELREYNTVHGIWKYFTVDDGQFDLKNQDYLMIGTLESYEKLQDYFGKNTLVPIYIEVEDGERLMRALVREKQQKIPKYTELCRRFLADTADFSEEKLQNLGVAEKFQNTDLNTILRKIYERIQYNRNNLH